MHDKFWVFSSPFYLFFFLYFSKRLFLPLCLTFWLAFHTQYANLGQWLAFVLILILFLLLFAFALTVLLFALAANLAKIYAPKFSVSPKFVFPAVFPLPAASLVSIVKDFMNDFTSIWLFFSLSLSCIFVSFLCLTKEASTWTLAD